MVNIYQEVVLLMSKGVEPKGNTQMRDALCKALGIVVPRKIASAERVEPDEDWELRSCRKQRHGVTWHG